MFSKMLNLLSRWIIFYAETLNLAEFKNFFFWQNNEIGSIVWQCVRDIFKYWLDSPQWLHVRDAHMKIYKKWQQSFSLFNFTRCHVVCALIKSCHIIHSMLSTFSATKYCCAIFLHPLSHKCSYGDINFQRFLIVVMRW